MKIDNNNWNTRVAHAKPPRPTLGGGRPNDYTLTTGYGWEGGHVCTLLRGAFG